MLGPEPYFLKNPEWYYHDDETNRYFLTDKAPKEAVESYNEFYDALASSNLSFYAMAMHDAEIILRERLKKQGKSQEEIETLVKKWREN